MNIPFLLSLLLSGFELICGLNADCIVEIVNVDRDEDIIGIDKNGDIVDIDTDEDIITEIKNNYNNTLYINILIKINY